MTGPSSSLTQMVSINDHEHVRSSKHITDIYRSLQIKMDGIKSSLKRKQECSKPCSSSLFVLN